MLAQSYYGPEFDQKEQEIRKLTTELEQIEQGQQRPTLFTSSPPLPTISPPSILLQLCFLQSSPKTRPNYLV